MRRYGMTFDVSTESLDKDYTLPIGECKVEREGTDVTLVSYSRGVHTCLQAAEALAAQGVSAEVCIHVHTHTHTHTCMHARTCMLLRGPHIRQTSPCCPYSMHSLVHTLCAVQVTYTHVHTYACAHCCMHVVWCR